jgi:uncharacterized protein
VEAKVQINVSGLLKSSLGTRLDYQVSDVVSIAGGDSLVQGEVWLTRTDRGILVKARLNTEVRVTCSRCLAVFSYPLVLNFEEEYFPVIDVVSGRSLPVPDEPGCFTIDGHHILDLTEAVRQYALLAIPMKPLCRQDCAGLCPTCGHNLNQGGCSCPPQGLDPRLSRLSKLLLTNDG